MILERQMHEECAAAIFPALDRYFAIQLSGELSDQVEAEPKSSYLAGARTLELMVWRKKHGDVLGCDAGASETSSSSHSVFTETETQTLPAVNFSAFEIKASAIHRTAPAWTGMGCDGADISTLFLTFEPVDHVPEKSAKIRAGHCLRDMARFDSRHP